MEGSTTANNYQEITITAINDLLQAESDEKFIYRKSRFVCCKNAIIERLTNEEIFNKYSISPPHSEQKYTVCYEIYVDFKLEIIESHKISINPILFIKSKFDSFNIKLLDNVSLPGIYFFECNIGDVELVNCSKTQYTTFDSCTDIKSLVISKSRINDLGIYNSRVGYFQCSSFSCDTIKIFNKSDFGDIVLQSDCIIRRIDIKGNKKIGDINFSKSKVSYFYLNKCKAGHLISQNSIFKQIVISRSSTNEIMFLEGSKLDKFWASRFNIGNFKIRGKSKMQFISMQGGEYVGEISFEEESQIDYFLLSSSFTDNLFFKDSTINSFHIFNSATGLISITKSTIRNIIINEVSRIGHFNAENSKIWKVHALNQCASFFLSGAKISILTLNNCKIPRFDISQDSDVECYINGGQVNHISFEKTCLGKNSVLSFSNVSIYALQIEEFAMLGNLFFRKIKISNKPFDWWYQDIKEINHCQSEEIKTNLEEIKAKYLTEKDELIEKFNKPTIRVSHSSLGKTEFTNCPLADYNFEFNNSKITECFISGGTVPSDNIIIIDDEGKYFEINLKETHVQKAFFYNQLKKVFDSQGDTYQAAQFQAKWAEHQKKSLKLEYRALKKEASLLKKPSKRLKLLFGELSQDIGIFRLNRWSNNHGESWMLALLFTFLTTGFFYLMFLWSIGRCFNPNGFDWSLIGYYLEFLTPTFNPGFVTGERPSSCSISLYYAGKAVFAYGLYQFIAAFRKHGRKK